MIYTATLNPAIDEVVNRTDGGDKITRYPGGKGINVSLVLNRFGVENVSFALSAGDELFSQYGLNTRFFGKSPVRVNRKLLLLGKTYEENQPGRAATEEAEMLFEALLKEIKPNDWVFLCGSVPVGLPADIYFNAINRIKQRGARAVLDTSGKPLIYGIQAQPDLIKPNIHELSQLYEVVNTLSLNEAENKARELAGRGIGMVIVSCGADGAFVCTENETYRAKARPITEKNSTGAGDTLLAAFVQEFLLTESLSEALQHSVELASSSAEKEWLF